MGKRAELYLRPVGYVSLVGQHSTCLFTASLTYFAWTFGVCLCSAETSDYILVEFETTERVDGPHVGPYLLIVFLPVVVEGVE